eukprot:m.44073 g.44073  ORF g.44073 m.44073 type:complete len:174 (-) comp10044_c0_seq2:1129-1650(-)
MSCFVRHLQSYRRTFCTGATVLYNNSVGVVGAGNFGVLHEKVLQQLGEKAAGCFEPNAWEKLENYSPSSPRFNCLDEVSRHYVRLRPIASVSNSSQTRMHVPTVPYVPKRFASNYAAVKENIPLSATELLQEFVRTPSVNPNYFGTSKKEDKDIMQSVPIFKICVEKQEWQLS